MCYTSKKMSLDAGQTYIKFLLHHLFNLCAFMEIVLPFLRVVEVMLIK